MKNISTLISIILLSSSFFSHSQTSECDDFTTGAWSNGDTIGLNSQGYPILNLDGFWSVNNDPGSAIPGLSGGGGSISMDFDGTEQQFVFETYNYDPAESIFELNGTSTFNLAASFPLTLGDFTITVDETVDYGVVIGNNIELTITGPLENLKVTGLETGILSICRTSLSSTGDCHDFTDGTWSDADTMGYTQEGFPIIDTDDSWLTDSWADGFVSGGTGGIEFGFSGSNQTITFDMFHTAFLDGMYAVINGTDSINFSDAFPMTVGGIEVELTTSTADPFTGVQDLLLTLTGEVDQVTIYGLELVLEELCFSSTSAIDDCDDFTDGTWTDADTIGFTHEGFPVVDLDDSWSVDSWADGLVSGGEGGLYVGFDGSDQTITFDMFHTAFLNGMYIIINGTDSVNLSDVFPMTVGGIEVDLTASIADPFTGVQELELTLIGEVDETVIYGVELVVEELCTSEEGETASLQQWTNETENVVSVYPTSATEGIHIVSSTEMVLIRIVSMSGEMVVEDSVNNQLNEYISVSDMLPGLYITIIQTADGQVYNEKWVKTQ